MKAQDLIDKLKHCLEIPTWYVMGGFGQRLGVDWINWNYKYNKQHKDAIEQHYTNPYTFGFDCVCLIKANLFWGFEGAQDKENGGSKYDAKNDWSVGEMKKHCYDLSKDFGENDLIAGELVFLGSSHIGLYIGNGEVIESTPAWAGNVQRTLLPWRNTTNYEALPVREWDQHGKFEYIEYATDWKAEADRLKKKCDEIAEERDKAYAERDKAIANAETAHNALEQAKNALQDAEGKYTSLVEECAQIKAEHAHCEADIEELQNELKKTKAEAMAEALRANDEIGNLKIQLNAIKAEKADMDGDGHATMGDVWALFLRVLRGNPK